MAQDEDHIYIGDLGNNGGKRRDLAIYKIAKSAGINKSSKINAVEMEIKYPDRIDFMPRAYQHNFDCEAILAAEDSLYLFSKNHLDKQCRLYSFAKDGTQTIATLKDRFDTKGMITGAGADKENKILALVGYNFQVETDYFGPFVWLFWDYPANQYFQGKQKRINLPYIAQAEAITYWKDGQFLISTEESRQTKALLMLFDAKRWIDDYKAN